MNKLVLFAALAASLVGGCATTPPNYVDNVDTRKVAAIEHVARTSGVEVHWVNYPQRRELVAVTAAPTGT